MVASTGVQTADQALQHKLGKKILWPHQAQTLVIVGGTTPDVHAGQQAGNPALLEVSTFGVNSMLFDSGDEIGWMFPREFLWDADLQEDIRLKLVTTQLGTVETGIDWIASIKGFANAAALTGFAAADSPDGSIVFPALVGAIAFEVMETDSIGFALTKGVLAADTLIGITVELQDKGTQTANQNGLICAIIEYTREICDSEGIRRST